MKNKIVLLATAASSALLASTAIAANHGAALEACENCANELTFV